MDFKAKTVLKLKFKSSLNIRAVQGLKTGEVSGHYVDCSTCCFYILLFKHGNCLAFGFFMNIYLKHSVLN